MKRVTGIGETKEWYKKHLGLPVDDKLGVD